MPLAGPGQFDDLLGDDSVRKIVCKPKGCARHFKRGMENLLVSGSASKSSKQDATAMAKSPPKAISSVRRLVRSAIYSQRHSNHTPTKAPGGRGIAATGEVRPMPAQYVKAYIKRNKNDAADAEAICEAVQRPTMRFVPVKTADQQATVLLHRGRERLVRDGGVRQELATGSVALIT